MFTEKKNSQNNKIRLDILTTEQPENGIEFRGNKIYVNSQDPTLYKRLYDQAIANYEQ